MRRSWMLEFAGGTTIVAGVAVVALMAAFRTAPDDTVRWAIAGFGAMALAIIASGSWLAREHGRVGVSFVAALGVGLVVKATLLAVVVIGAAARGSAALTGALSGLAVGFLPLTAFEMIWFSRRARVVRSRTEPPA